MKQKHHKTQKQSFLEGALILIFANIVTKAIGAVFKIPLKNLIGGDGMGIYNTAYTPFAFFMTLATMGIPVAVSRMTAQAEAMGQARQIRSVVRVSLLIAGSVGLVFCVLLWAVSGPFVRAIPNVRAHTAVMLFAPALVFSAVLSVLRGYYQGMSNMIPTAMSQLVESAARLIFGYAFAYLAIRLGYGVETAAAAAVLGVVLSTLCGLLYMLIREAAVKSIKRLPAGKNTDGREIASSVWRIALPITLASGISALTGFIDMFVIQNRLQTIGYTEKSASTLYGVYETMCVSLINLPQTLIAAVTVSLIPMVASSVARGDREHTTRGVDSALRLVSMMAFPCAAGLLAMTEPILSLLFREDAATAVPLLKALAPATVFISFVSITNAILQAIGKERLSLCTMTAGAVIKLAVSYWLIGQPDVGILGAPIGTVACYAAVMLLNFVLLLMDPDAAPKKWLSFLKPAFASCLMAAFLLLLTPWLSTILPRTAAVPILIASGALFYALSLAAIRGIYREDVLMLPKGEKIAEILKLSQEK